MRGLSAAERIAIQVRPHGPWHVLWSEIKPDYAPLARSLRGLFHPYDEQRLDSFLTAAAPRQGSGPVPVIQRELFPNNREGGTPPMRRLTLRELNEQHGGMLPPDAVLRPDDEPEHPPPASRGKRWSRSERFAQLNAFVDFGISTANLTPAEALTWIVLFRDTKSSGVARTGQADIARRTGLDVRTVRRAIATLATRGMLRVARRGRLNAGPSVYRLHPTGDT